MAGFGCAENCSPRLLWCFGWCLPTVTRITTSWTTSCSKKSNNRIPIWSICLKPQSVSTDVHRLKFRERKQRISCGQPGSSGKLRSWSWDWLPILERFFSGAQVPTNIRAASFYELAGCLLGKSSGHVYVRKLCFQPCPRVCQWSVHHCWRMEQVTWKRSGIMRPEGIIRTSLFSSTTLPTTQVRAVLCQPHSFLSFPRIAGCGFSKILSSVSKVFWLLCVTSCCDKSSHFQVTTRIQRVPPRVSRTTHSVQATTATQMTRASWPSVVEEAGPFQIICRIYYIGSIQRNNSRSCVEWWFCILSFAHRRPLEWHWTLSFQPRRHTSHAGGTSVPEGIYSNEEDVWVLLVTDRWSCTERWFKYVTLTACTHSVRKLCTLVDDSCREISWNFTQNSPFDICTSETWDSKLFVSIHQSSVFPPVILCPCPLAGFVDPNHTSMPVKGRGRPKGSKKGSPEVCFLYHQVPFGSLISTMYFSLCISIWQNIYCLAKLTTSSLVGVLNLPFENDV